MSFWKNLFGKKTGGCGCCCGPKLFLPEEAAVLKNCDEHVVIGKILEITAHPDESVTRVRVTKTEIAPGVTEQILCGGVNIAVGEYVPVATVGAQLAPDFVISERNIRGTVSRGMICSRTELGLPQGNEPEHGIWLLGERFASQLGKKVRDLC